LSPSASAIRRAASGAIVLMSMKIVGALAPESAPSLPRRTASTSGPSVTIEITNSAPLAHSAGVAACFAPSLTRGSALEAVRFHTVT